MSDINVAELSQQDRELIRASLAAACEGPFFEDWEFQTLMGVTRAEMADVLAAWSSPVDARPNEAAAELQSNAIRNALLNLLGYPLSDRQIAALENEWNVERTSLSDLRARLG